MPSEANPKVIESLQKSVSLHLTAIEHYQAAAAHMERIGYKKLAARFGADANEEREHLQAVMARLEFYMTQPTYQHQPPSWPRGDVPGILASSLALETAAAGVERQNVTAAREAGDEVSATIFASLLEGSEASILAIEADRVLIEQIGLDNWLANQT